MWILTGASLVWSCWMSVVSAATSACEMSGSIRRVTAFSPAPPTPSTRMTAMYAPGSGTRCRRGGGSGSGSSRGRSGSRAGGGFASGSGLRSGRRTGSGGAGAAFSIHSGTCSTVCSGGSTGLAAGCAGSACSAGSASVRPSFSACRCAASVARNSSASGPSRMLARLRAIEHLLRELAVGLGGASAGIVFQHGGALDRRLRVANGLANPRVEDQVAEILLEDLHRLARVQRAAVEHRREDPFDRDVWVQVLADHRERVLQLDQPS